MLMFTEKKQKYISSIKDFNQYEFSKMKGSMWLINVLILNEKLHKKGYNFGVNFFLLENRNSDVFLKKMKKIIPFYDSNIYMSKTKKINENGEIYKEMYVLFQSEENMINFINKIIKSDIN